MALGAGSTLSSCKSTALSTDQGQASVVVSAEAFGAVGDCPTREPSGPNEIRAVQFGRFRSLDPETEKDKATTFVYSRVDEAKGQKQGLTLREAQWQARIGGSVCTRQMDRQIVVAGTVFANGLFKASTVAAVRSATSTQEVRYTVFSRDEQNQGFKRILNCVLVHGYGTTGIVAEVFNDDNILPYFGAYYYGSKTVEALLNTVCQRVTVIVQESNDTSILEMTRRTEEFIREVACSDRVVPNRFGMAQWRCGLIGHSKGGAVVTNIARRCMNMTSDLGGPVCQSIGEIYSATGVVLGAGATFLIYGAYRTESRDTQDQILGSFYQLDWNNFLDGISDFTSKAKGKAIGVLWKIFAPFEQNPTWRDLSPGTLLEGGVPLAVINNVELNKRGWLRADYAASGVDFVFGKAIVDVIGVGTPTTSNPADINLKISEAFGYSIQMLHREDMKRLYEEGLRLMSYNTKFFDPAVSNGAFMKRFTWDEYQRSDGFVEIASALGMCRKGGTAVKACTVLHNINHSASAGLAKEAQDDFVTQFATGDAP